MHSSRMRTVRCSGRQLVDGLSAQRGLSAWGVSAQGVWQTSPPAGRMTDTCKNIILPQGSNNCFKSQDEHNEFNSISFMRDKEKHFFRAKYAITRIYSSTTRNVGELRNSLNHSVLLTLVNPGGTRVKYCPHWRPYFRGPEISGSATVGGGLHHFAG